MFWLTNVLIDRICYVCSNCYRQQKGIIYLKFSDRRLCALCFTSEGPLLLTRFKFTSFINCVWKYLSIPNLKPHSRWSLGFDNSVHLTINRECDYLSMLMLLKGPREFCARSMDRKNQELVPIHPGVLFVFGPENWVENDEWLLIYEGKYNLYQSQIQNHPYLNLNSIWCREACFNDNNNKIIEGMYSGTLLIPCTHTKGQ